MTTTNPTAATLDALEGSAIRVLADVLRTAGALKEIRPELHISGRTPQEAGRQSVTEEYGRLTVECLPFTVLDVISGARRLRTTEEPWSGTHTAVVDLASALIALTMSRSRLADGADELATSSPAVSALFGEAAEHAAVVIDAVAPIVGLTTTRT